MFLKDFKMNSEIRLRHWIGGALIALAVSAASSCGLQPAKAQTVRVMRQDIPAPSGLAAPVKEDAMSLGIDPPMPYEPTDEELAAMGYRF